MTVSRPAILLVLVTSLSSLLNGQTKVRVETLVVGTWSATIAGDRWDLSVEQNHQYAIFRATELGDTIVVSMGQWTVEADTFCIIPPGRAGLCDRLEITDATDPAETRWRFTDVGGSGFSWVAYRLGYAPWDTPDRRRRAEDRVYQLSDVTLKPRVLSCSWPARLPEGETGPVRVTTRFVVGVDSTVSNIEVVDPPSVAVRDAAYAVVNSCRVAPGRLEDGQVVRVRVELALEFPGTRS